MDDKQLEITLTEELRVSQAKEKGKKYREEFEKAKRKISGRFSEHQENMAFYEGKQYQLSKYKISRPWVVRMRTPYASVAIDTRVSSLIASDYRGDLIPMKPEDSDSIESLNNFKDDEWDRMNLNQKINESIKTSAIVREAYVHFRWVDKPLGNRKGYIDCSAIDMPSSVYIDPSALNFKDARYVSVLARKSKDELKEMYPKFKATIEKMGSSTTPDDRGEVYLGEEYMSEQDNVLTLITHYRKDDGIIKKYILIEDMMVEEKALDGLTCFPIAQMRWKRSAGSCYGIALMDELIDLQKAINSIESAVTNTAISYSAPSYGVRKGSGIDPKEVAVAAGAPGMVLSIEGNIDEAIKPLNLPKLDNAVIGVKQDFVSIMDRIAGISNPYLGSVGTAGNTSGGTKMALERARIIEADVIHNIELFVEDITNILIEFIGAQYSGETVTSRKMDKATGEVNFEENAIPLDTEDIQYSFFINLNTKTSYSKEREKEMILELYQMSHQYKDEIKLVNQLDVLESYDLSNKEILVDRFKKMTAKSDDQRAQLIVEMTTTGTQLGVSAEAIQKAIVELMGASSETPITDEIMAQMQQMASQQNQMRQQAMQGFQQDLQTAGVPSQMIQMAQGQMGNQQAMPPEMPQEAGPEQQMM